MPVLVCHPATPCAAITSVTAEARWLPDGRLGFYYVLAGRSSQVRVPALALAQADRADELWRHTCCEAFVAGPTEGGYSEFNFSPSGAWAAYRFTAYREGMRPVAVVADPVIDVRITGDRIELDAFIGSRSVPLSDEGLHLGLTVVVEDLSGALSYWGLAHPLPRPDFHHADGFRFALPAPVSDRQRLGNL
ncbi:MAG: DOMON-like domain-containing protein [Steroidobacteraceae bacterium]